MNAFILDIAAYLNSKLILFHLITLCQSNAVVPLPDFFESADFLDPNLRISDSVNTKIGKSVTPNFGTIKIGRV